MTILIAMALFAFTMSITPGPTNIILLSTGANHGFRKAVPFATGSAIGFSSLNIIIGLGLGKFAPDDGFLLMIISYIGAGFIGYLGFKIMSSTPQITFAEKDKNIPGFLIGMITSWLNPKSWIAVIAGISAFSLAGKYNELVIYVSIYIVIGYSCILLWAFAGSKIAPYLTCAKYMKIFNVTMGISLMAIAVYLALL